MDYIYLFLHLILPIALPIFFMLVSANGDFQERINKLFVLKSNESLIRQNLFWLSLIVPVGLFVSFGAVCWKGYRLDLSQEGVSLFLSISTFPLALLSAAIPLGVVVASFHSTQQTAEQIRQASIKNNLEAYYLHRTEFFKHFERHETVNYLGALEGKFVPHPLLYNNCSPGAPEEGVPKRSEGYFHQIDAAFSSAATFMHIVFTHQYSEKVFNIYLCNACVSMHAVSNLLGLPEIYRDMAANSLLVEPPTQPGKEVEKYLTVGVKASDIVAAFRYARDFYVNLAAFYGYEHPDLPEDVKYLGTGGKVFSLPGWANVAKFKEDLFENYVKRYGFKVTKPSEIVPYETDDAEGMA
ncbi:hypothetical protein [Pseudomonas hunanensis]|uniref:hypothetical protein n=1 Tax=Pseudomonas hunanensis TaxID=1247546 RepID=UPI0011AF9BE9|nr:hypothetical protein [Pseudomonas hunanensis]